MGKLESLCLKSDEILQKAYCPIRKDCTDSERLKSKLRFPYKRSSKTEGDSNSKKVEVRVSEQESRFAFVEAIIQDDDLQYCVETPTAKTYNFQDKSNKGNPIVDENGQSAMMDMTLFSNEEEINIEFKSQGISKEATDHMVIRKDLLKLMAEGKNGLFHHLYKSANKGTIPGLLGVCRLYLNEHIEYINKEQYILFHIHVLDPGHSSGSGYSITKKLILSEYKSNFFNYEHTDYENTMKEASNGWKYSRYKVEC